MKINENISPMLLEEIDKPFNSKDYYFEVKLDGARTIAHLSKNGVYLHNKRFVDITATYPELKDINKQVNKECILDGELVILDRDGRPLFSGLQKRAHLKDAKKIKRLASELPAKFVAFDILYIDGKDITNLPLTERKTLLRQTVTPNSFIELSQGILEKGKELFEIVKANNMEGIVAKRLDSKYLIGKRTHNWLKIKNWKDEDFVIVGFTIESNKPKDLLLAQYKGKNLVLRSSIYFGFSKFDIDTILNFALDNLLHSPPYQITLLKDIKYDVIWIKPKLVCTVEYMLLTDNLGMRQPIFKGIRTDKSPTSCTLPKEFYAKLKSS